MEKFKEKVLQNSKMSTLEKDVLSLRYGFNDGTCKTLIETASILDLTREKVRQIEKEALLKIK